MNFTSSSRLLTDIDHDLGYKNQYNQEDATKILNIVNKCTLIELKNFNISQLRLLKLIKHRENQEFKRVEDLLELEGFGIKVLEKFCNSILQTDLKDAIVDEVVEAQPQAIAKKHSFVTPALIESVRKKITSIVSFQHDLNFFAWSKICYNPAADNIESLKYYVEEWYCYEIRNSDKKLNLSDLTQLLVHLNDHIPQADVYVMEALPMVSTMRSGQSQIVVNIQKAQFYAMVCALMGARKSLKFDLPDKSLVDTVYFLRTFLPSRFYKYLVGTERIASAKVVEKIFEYQDPSIKPTENPKFESISIPMELQNYWKSTTPVQQEYLGNSLLNGLTFMKLSVEKCNKCIASVK